MHSGHGLGCRSRLNGRRSLATRPRNKKDDEDNERDRYEASTDDELYWHGVSLALPVPAAGLEPATYRLGVGRSVH